MDRTIRRCFRKTPEELVELFESDEHIGEQRDAVTKLMTILLYRKIDGVRIGATLYRAGCTRIWTKALESFGYYLRKVNGEIHSFIYSHHDNRRRRKNTNLSRILDDQNVIVNLPTDFVFEAYKFMLNESHASETERAVFHANVIDRLVEMAIETKRRDIFDLALRIATIRYADNAIIKTWHSGQVPV